MNKKYVDDFMKEFDQGKNILQVNSNNSKETVQPPLWCDKGHPSLNVN